MYMYPNKHGATEPRRAVVPTASVPACVGDAGPMARFGSVVHVCLTIYWFITRAVPPPCRPVALVCPALAKPLRLPWGAPPYRHYVFTMCSLCVHSVPVPSPLVVPP